MCLRIVNIRSLSGFVLLSISIISIFLFASSYFYESAAKGNLSEKFVSAARDTKLSVVNIRAIFKVAKRGMLDRGKRFEVKGQGSGVIADKEGYIITNNHVVKVLMKLLLDCMTAVNIKLNLLVEIKKRILLC